MSYSLFDTEKTASLIKLGYLFELNETHPTFTRLRQPVYCWYRCDSPRVAPIIYQHLILDNLNFSTQEEYKVWVTEWKISNDYIIKKIRDFKKKNEQSHRELFSITSHNMLILRAKAKEKAKTIEQIIGNRKCFNN